MAIPKLGKKTKLADWIVLILCTLIYFLQAGLQRTGTLIFVACMDRYNVNREKASIPFMVCSIVSNISGPLFGYLGNKFQLRSVVTFGNILLAVGVFVSFWAENIIFLTFFWGIVGGLGKGATFALILEFLNRHFDKHLSTAFGIYFAGSSIGATIIPYLAKALLDYYGLSGTFLILGGLALNAIPASLALPVYQKTPHQNHVIQQIVDQSGETDLKASACIFYIEQHPQTVMEEEKVVNNDGLRISFKTGCYTINGTHKRKQQARDPKLLVFSSFGIFLNPIFLAIGIRSSCSLCIVATLNVILVDYCFEKSITSDQGVYVVMVVSITDIMGRVGLGWITDYGFIGDINFLAISFILLGVSCLLYIWSNGFIMCIVSSVLYGSMYGAVAAYSPKMYKDYIEPKDRTMAVASRNFFFTPVAIAMPYILGYFKDTGKLYDGLMYIFGVLSLLAAVLTFVVPHLAKRQINSIKSSDKT